MRKHLLVLALLSLSAISVQAQNVGIGTSTPGSRLTVNGSFAGGYTAVSTATYTILDNDYYLAWAGPAAGTLTLPTPTALTKGRVYKIRNATALFGLTIAPASGVLVDGLASLTIPAGQAVELIANGNTSGTAWEVVGLVSATANSAGAGASAGTIGGAGGACSPAPTATGTFVVGTPTTTSQALAVTVTVATPGTYTIGTTTANGISFFAAGYLATTGVQTVALYAHGTPAAAGSFAYTVAYGSSLCTTSVTTVPLANFNCAGATQTLSTTGALVNGTAYTSTYTVPYTAGSGLSYPSAAQTVSGLTLTRAAGTYAAGGGNVVYSLAGTYTGPSNSSAAFTTECGATINFGDAIRGALAAAGCASCAAYDAAAVNNWVPITAAEYNAVQSNISGMGAYGAPASQMASAALTSWSANYTTTMDFTTQTPLPASTYPVALSIRSGNNPNTPATMAGLKLKVSSTSQSAGYADLPAGVSTPNASTTPLANTVYYYVLRRPTTLTAASASNMAIFTPVVYQLGARGGGSSFYESSDSATLSNAFSSVPLFQVLSTPSKQW